MPVSAGDASCMTTPVGSLPPVPQDGSVTTWSIERHTHAAASVILGWRGYRAIVRRAYRQPVPTGHRGRPRLTVPPTLRLTQTIKHRDHHGWLLSVETRATLGELVVTPGTMQMERLNGTFRERLNALTRKTYAFAKRDSPWDALVHLHLFEHDWLRPHPALRLPAPTAHRRYLPRTPAMVLTLADHPWSWTECLTSPLPCHP